MLISSRFFKTQFGYSLIELLIVMAIITLVSLITVSRLYTSSTGDTGGAERVLAEVEARVVERRADAVRLNGESSRAGLTSFSVVPLPIDFGNSASTASLRINGNDTDGDCVDDQTHLPLTCLNIADGSGTWQTAFNDDALNLPKGWQIVSSPNELGNLPLIGGGANGRGVLVTVVGFDATGNALAQEPGAAAATWQKYPTGAAVSVAPTANTAPFWAIYFVVADSNTSSAGRDGQTPLIKAAVAIAVHPSGLIEQFRYDGTNWIGFQNRTL